MPTADDMNPTPAGPTRNTSRASGVNSDRGEPNTIALMSTRNVARTSRRLRAYRRPSATVRKLGLAAPGAGGMGAIMRTAMIAAPYVTRSMR